MNNLKKIVRPYYYNFKEKLYTLYLRSALLNKTFTIISNNCWAGSVYQDLNLPFKTPTIGLFFYGPCYIQFLKNIMHYIECPLYFIQESKYDIANAERKRRNINYPIGVIDDVEIHFLHYKNEQEAYQKWNTRKKRINFNNLFVSFSDVDIINPNLIYEFDKLNLSHKIFFSAKNFDEIKSLVWLKCYEDRNQIGVITTHKWNYRRYFNVVKWLNQNKQ